MRKKDFFTKYLKLKDFLIWLRETAEEDQKKGNTGLYSDGYIAGLNQAIIHLVDLLPEENS